MSSQDLSTALSRLRARLDANDRLKDESVVVQAMDAMFEKVGGAAGFGQFLADLVDDAKKEGTSLDNRRKLVGTLKGWFDGYDEITARSLDLSNVDREDLHMVMIAALVEQVRSDPEFAAGIVCEAARGMSRQAIGDLIGNLQRLEQGEAAPTFKAISHTPEASE